jgi:hypothetical protein
MSVRTGNGDNEEGKKDKILENHLVNCGLEENDCRPIPHGTKGEEMIFFVLAGACFLTTFFPKTLMCRK